MPQTVSVKDHLKALHDNLKEAANKQDAQAKSDIRSAITHMEEARVQLQAQLRSDDAKRKEQTERTLQKLEDVARNSKNALDSTGDAMRTHLKQTIASAKGALDEAK